MPLLASCQLYPQNNVGIESHKAQNRMVSLTPFKYFYLIWRIYSIDPNIIIKISKLIYKNNMVNYTISHTEIILAILDYLREQGLANSMLELEEESKIQLVQYSKEVNFFRSLLLKGHFAEAENFLEPLRQK